MPRIPDSIMDIAVYLYYDTFRADVGESLGGSGFLFAVDCKSVPNLSHALVATNSHVIEDGATVVRINNKDGSTSVWDFSERDWFHHPDGADVAIAFAPVTGQMRFKGVGLEDFISRESYQSLQIGAGDETFLIGRYVGADGKQVNTPTARFGTIAQSGTVMLAGRRDVPQESFLIEGRSIAGFSGSAVYVYQATGFGERGVPNWNPRLLGIDWSHPAYREPLRDARGDPASQDLHVHANSGFMAVIPAWKIADMIATPEMTAILDAREAQLMRTRA